MKANRADLLAQLETLLPGISAQESIEQSSCIVFQEGYAATFNDEIAMRTKTPLKITGAVVAAPLLALLRQMTEDEIDVSTSGHGTDAEIVIGGKHREARIRMEAEITLGIDVVEQPREWKPLHEKFAEAISIVEQCAGKDENKFHTTCIHITERYAEACDNLQAARYKLTTGFESETCVRRDSIRHIVPLGMNQFSETETWVHFRNPQRVVLSLRRFNEDYPSLRKHLEVEGTPAQLPRGLAEAVKRAEVFAAGTGSSGTVLVSLKPGKLTLRSESGWGKYTEWKKIKYDGQPLSFLIAPAILQDIVKKHSECVVTEKRLKVDGGRFIYVTVLGVPSETPREKNRGEKEHQNQD